MDGSTFDGWLQELLALTCEEQPVVVAHSLTGGLAAGFAARHGGLVRGPRIYASPGIGPYRMPLRLRALVSHVKRAMGQLFKAGMKQVSDPELRRIEVPTSLLWARRDRFVPLALGEEAAARLGWPLHVVQDAGHVPHIEQREAWLDALGREA